MIFQDFSELSLFLFQRPLLLLGLLLLWRLLRHLLRPHLLLHPQVRVGLGGGRGKLVEGLADVEEVQGVKLLAGDLGEGREAVGLAPRT